MATTKTKNAAPREDAPPPQPVTALAPTRMPLAPGIAKEYGIEPAQWRVLLDQIFPSAKTPEAILMALEYCRARKLDIFKKPVHIVPMWSTAHGREIETVWPGISEIRTTAARTGEYAGLDAPVFGPMKKTVFTGRIKKWEERQQVWKDVEVEVTYPEWASIVAYRIVKGVRVPFHAILYWEETYARISPSEVPNAMWEKRPVGQFLKCLEAAVLREAFPEGIGSDYAAEEMEGRTIEMAGPAVADAIAAAARISAPPPPPPPDKKTEEPKPDPAKPIPDDEVNAFLDKIDLDLRECTTTDEVEGVFVRLQVEAKLDGREEALDEAYRIREKHLTRTTPEDEPGDGANPTAEERPFPGDEPMPGKGKSK